MPRIHLSLPPDTYAELVRLCALWHLGPSSAVRLLIAQESARPHGRTELPGFAGTAEQARQEKTK